MNSRFILVILLAVCWFVSLASCSERQVDSGGLQPLPEPPSLNSEEVAIGRLLFFDGRLSGDGTTSCATCHMPEKAFTDGSALSAGYPSTLYFRNTPTVMNAGFRKRLYWDGRMDGADLPTLVRDHVAEAHFLQADGRLVIERLRQVSEYENSFKKVYGGEPSYGKILNAISAYVRSINSVKAPLDRYLKGEKGALSEAASRGLSLFIGKAGCAQCHTGPMLTDESYHRLGIRQNPDIFGEPLRHISFRRFFKTLGVDGYAQLDRDIGLYALTKDPEDKGKFLTPSLREVSRTPPYMHNGVLQTLEEVVEFYDTAGGARSDLRPLGLSTQEKEELVEFLKTFAGKETAEEPPPPPDYSVRELGRN